MLNFEFLDTGLGMVSPAYCVLIFEQKCSSCYNSIKRPNFVAWLPLLLEILGNMCNAIVC